MYDTACSSISIAPLFSPDHDRNHDEAVHIIKDRLGRLDYFTVITQRTRQIVDRSSSINENV
jgi:hypothetical protein